MIQFEQVTKRYLSKTALIDVDLEFPAGKIIGVVGENGSGKSTMLKLIAGLLRPTKGRVLVNGEPSHRRIARKVAYLSELETYYPFFTVQETVDYHAAQFGDLDRKKAREIIEFMGLDPNAKIKHLSKGNRGRVKLVVTLARKAPYILMDEPLSGLDPIVRDSIIKGMISFIDLDYQTVVITTHEVIEVEPLLDQVVALREGQVIKVMDLDAFRSNEGMSLAEWMTNHYAGHSPLKKQGS